MPSKADFVHLHLHTQYSLLDGACKIEPLMKRAKELKFSALAITDHGNLFGAVEFYQAALRYGIQPIIGCEVYFSPKGRSNRTGRGGVENAHHMLLLAANQTGYTNLMTLVSKGYLEGFYYKPRIDTELLSEHHEGLIALTGCMSAEIPYLVRTQQDKMARDRLGDLMNLFGKDRLYLELQDHAISEERDITRALLGYSKELGLPLAATNDVHYLEPGDARAHECLLCLQTQTTLDDPRRMKFSTDEFYLKSADQMKALFKDQPDAIANTLEIARKCQLKLDFNKTHFPKFPLPEGVKDPEQYLRQLCEAGLSRRYGSTIPVRLRERMEHELRVIQKMGFTSYFLIVWDFIRFAREKGIPVGPGRGSAAGSLVAYCLAITNIDPIPHGLIFERFLNPDRITQPDIDIDFCYERRDEVIDYVRSKYGAQSVAQIITFGTMAARAGIRDVGRVMGMAYNEVDRIAKLIPTELNITLDSALEQEPRLKELYDNNEEISKLINTSRSLEGLTRHASTHAAGVVISDGPLTQHAPLFKTNDDQVTTQYAMSSLEKIGLLKMDFLGLRTLTVIYDAVKIIKETRGVDLEIDNIPLDDEKTYALLASGQSLGVFQLESSGMRDILKKLKAERFEDITAILALYRPGPLGSGMVDDFIQRRHGRVEIHYDHPSLEPILKETYGVILYQEQVMKIVSRLAGFSLSQADSLRRAMSKKTPAVMERQRQVFHEGAHKNGVDKRTATKVFNLIEYFAGYGFNKSHSAAYALISYQTAYLKANYTSEFMVALLTSEKDNTDKVVVYIEDCRRMGIKVLPPDVNDSFARFTLSDGSIRFGLSAIKNVGLGAIESVVQGRQEGQPYTYLYDFCERTDLRLTNRKVIESLIKCGAMDSFNVPRAQLMAQVDQALQAAGSVQKDRQRGQTSFLDAFGKDPSFHRSNADISKLEEWPDHQKLAYEKELLGYYVTGHPLKRFAKDFARYSSLNTKQLAQIKSERETSIGGIITRFREIMTRKGDPMAFVTLEDLEGSVEIVVFPEVFKRHRDLIVQDAVLFVRGKISLRDDTPKILADELIPIENLGKHLTRSILIDVGLATVNQDVLTRLKAILLAHPGKIPTNLRFATPDGCTTSVLPDPDHNVEPSDDLFSELERLLGDHAITVQT